MYQRLSAVLFPLVALLFIGSIYWGYQEHQEKNSILIKAENQYQRAFHELSYNVQQLHNQLGHTLAVNSTSKNYHRKSLVNVWRLTSDAQSKINQLPLTLLPFSKTEDFLARIANFSYRTAVRDLNQEPLSAKEHETLKTLYAKSKEITNDLQGMQSKVLQHGLRWMDVETALATEQSSSDNTIIDGFKTVDKKVEGYPEINWGPSVSAMFERRSIKMLSGTPVTAKDVKHKAAKFLGVSDPNRIKVTEQGQSTEYATYSAVLERKEGNVQLDFSKKGGQLLRFLDNRDIGKKRVGVARAEQSAKKFLDTHGYPSLTAVSYDNNGRSVNLNFVAIQGKVLIYPEKLTVKVGLDNGEVVGMHAEDFAYEHRTRKIEKPKLSEAEARKVLNPEFKVNRTEQAIIKNELSKEVLCYEFIGKINGQFYRIYVNANDGVEESIEQIPGIGEDNLPATS
ncbi:germination protein YpeB [Paenibacillus sp. GCM10012307]|uniref:Germination protein YpeB n=1 Tax=Paenibacillus roseus TaxID=2798579 RepID=A0A934J8E7_9BACL|nr:germination protein YpeB [Paenibacillus roseus]MBJ6363498.1 germination protein YpeB [Paenibacillus roseus]